jgi:hypothetical protein
MTLRDLAEDNLEARLGLVSAAGKQWSEGCRDQRGTAAFVNFVYVEWSYL